MMVATDFVQPAKVTIDLYCIYEMRITNAAKPHTRWCEVLLDKAYSFLRFYLFPNKYIIFLQDFKI